MNTKPKTLNTLSFVDVICNFKTLGVGSILTLDGTIIGTSISLEDINWTLNKNGVVLDSGTGQFPTHYYTVHDDDLGTSIAFELEASNDFGNPVSTTLCEVTIPKDDAACLHISSILINPDRNFTDDCFGIFFDTSEIELISIKNSGSTDIDLSGYKLVISGAPETEINLYEKGVIAAGQTIEISDFFTNTNLGELDNNEASVSILDSSNNVVDIVSYPLSSETTSYGYSSTPSNGANRHPV